ncbi:RNA polymerase sigma factor [Candidatus Saccharibacteria bacterium]|nr:RNA polymerase sigma factor [Candidatus Saccharibacteria bacterium]
MQNWLLAIARNEANDEIRRERRRPAIAGIEHGTLGDAVVAPEFRSTASDPAQVYENSQHIRNLIKLLTDIPYEQRRPLFMFGLGWSYKEIEWLLGLSPATVKWRIYKGREAIIKASEAEDFSGQAVPQAVGETAIKVELLSPA